MLSGGGLCDTQSAKVKLTNTPDFGSALVVLSSALHMVVVEQIDNSASLYGCSIAQHHVCLLVKAQVRRVCVLVYSGYKICICVLFFCWQIHFGIIGSTLHCI